MEANTMDEDVRVDYKKLYFLLFNQISYALEAMEELDLGKAKKLLIEAHVKAEEVYLEDTDPVDK